MLTHDTYASIINTYSTRKVLVIGDFILDVYLHGTSRRLSPEAPVPIVDIARKATYPGGAGNTACNLAMLGAAVTLCTVVGEDDDGRHARTLLQDLGIATDGVLQTSQRHTIIKTRVVCDRHTITRFDSGTETPIDAVTEWTLIRYLSRNIRKFDAVIVSDYDKGVCTPRVLETLLSLRNHCPYIAVDSKRLAFFRALHPDLVKPNYEEALALTQERYQPDDRHEHVQRMGASLYDATQAALIAVTLDKAGSVVLQAGKPVHYEKAPTVTTPFVAGAGDTYVGAFLLSALAGATPAACATLATSAATVAVDKENTGACTCHELLQYMNGHQKYIGSQPALAALCDHYRAAGKQVVFTNGCFDILHSGHVAYLEAARALGDVLIVGVNTDDSIRRLKGKSRPVNGLGDRIHVLAGLHAVDHLVAFGDDGDDTPATLIGLACPDVFVKGEDYAGKELPEAEALITAGSKIIFLPLTPNRSTTAIIEKIHGSTRALPVN
ncbi:adenylyltransferase/cytidyltransferase family protein [Fulvivirgaceae bacterium PWU5]|uniref:Adenylyltransferase/cytidyltransferase family protein n=1 Tax=Dawidia cretensis TaxID=2782350 RepID=A0AAP2GPE9_9BACT|nr:PfkB family carbohydrate kinase [Dawidia cretensis]MBT1708164.1 adenylyltransferase/cytidyltransferase family protein [Dawidia cretensis]